jgi:hypothetical protein
MKIWPASAIYFREDDTFVVVFAFVHLRMLHGREASAWCSNRTKSGALPPLFLFARRSRGGCLGPQGFQVRRKSIQFSSQRAAQVVRKRTIREHLPSVKHRQRDLLDKRFVRRYPRFAQREGRSVGDWSWACRLGGLEVMSARVTEMESDPISPFLDFPQFRPLRLGT